MNNEQDKWVDEIRQEALNAGFADVGFCSVRPFEDWRRVAPAAILATMTDDPLSLMANARCIVVLVSRYGVFEPWPEGTAEICHYYVQSAVGRTAAQDVAAWIQDLGYAADVCTRLPAKQAAIRAGLGSQGLNTQFCHDRFGLLVNLQLVLTNVPVQGHDDPYRTCDLCCRCAEACPTGAVLTAGLDRDRCLRQHMISGAVIPRELRKPMGRKLIGCADCQEACPQADLIAKPIPVDLIEACSLERLLRRDKQACDTIARYVGRNYGRPLRLCRQAVIAAGNSGNQRDVPLLVNLLGDPDEVLRCHAAWALGQLGGQPARSALQAALGCEQQAAVLDELREALDQTILDRENLLV